jgi:hypothetical protein
VFTRDHKKYFCSEFPDERHLVRFILMLSSHVCLGLPKGPFPSDFPTKIHFACISLLSHASYNHRHLIPFDFPQQQHFSKTTNYEAPPYYVFV